MARIRPVGSGGGDPVSGGGGKRHKGRKPRAHHPRAKHPRAKHPRAHKAIPRGPAAEPVSAHSAWPHATAAPGAISPLTALDPTAPIPSEPLALTGAERGALHGALAAWGRQRDQALNRVWRRPGGLARLAGV